MDSLKWLVEHHSNLSPIEFGIVGRLLVHQLQHGTIPTKPASVAKIVGIHAMGLAEHAGILSNMFETCGKGQMWCPTYATALGRKSPTLFDLHEPVNALQVRTETLDAFTHYQKFHPQAKRTPKRTRLMCDRLDEGFTMQQLMNAVDGCHKSPFHNGDNDRGIKYLSFELILRSAKHVEEFAEINRTIGETADHGIGSPKERRSVDASRRWLEGRRTN